MPLESNEIIPLRIPELLNDLNLYEIPVYQRNYAWEAKEIEQLIQDVIDYAKDHPKQNYYIGTLVVANEQSGDKPTFSVIDGQQRLTTLSILIAVLKNRYHEKIDLDLTWYKEPNLKFASRERSKAAIKAVYDGEFIDNIDYELSIKAAYKICEVEIEKKTSENGITINQFAQYLFNYVTILRIALPQGIDLNHYFEIMNSRGEQLEKHEILKANLMEVFNTEEEQIRKKYSACFDLIWEACSNMEKYVQYGFSTEQRHLIFGDNDWNILAVENFDEFVSKVGHTVSDGHHKKISLSIDEILLGNHTEFKEEEISDAPDKFNSVINFPNFLLHVLKIQFPENIIPLDDKGILKAFNSNLPQEKAAKLEFVKDYIFNLLKSKFLFDKYIIKREFTANTGRWSLKCLKWYSQGKVKNTAKYVNTFGGEQNEAFDSNNRQVLMLLSMFHVSNPSMSYKYWLNAALHYLFNQVEVDGKEYICYLEHIAKSFVFDRYLSSWERKDYQEMIFKNENPIVRSLDNINIKKLSYGQIENNLVFNFLDYLIWVKDKNTAPKSRFKDFEFTPRSSVEHFYPQNPISGKRMENASVLNSFGNLCLISHENNSRYSNFLPQAKREHYEKSESKDSIKQTLMMELEKKVKNWAEDEIEIHFNEMLALFKENINSDFTPNSEVSLAKKWFKENRNHVKNKILLIRVLLGFGDCTKPLNRDKYNLFNFEHIRGSDAFKLFEAFVTSKNPKNLQEILDFHLSNETLKEDWKYLFVKYPEVIEYCKEGNFQWNRDGRFIYLLESDKITLYKAKELYSYLLKRYLDNIFKTNLHCDYECLYIPIAYNQGEYSISYSLDTRVSVIRVWNHEGTSIECDIEPIVNGNSSSIKNLEDYGWIKNKEGYFEKSGNSKLISLSTNQEENISKLETSFMKLLKNGLGIKLQ